MATTWAVVCLTVPACCLLCSDKMFKWRPSHITSTVWCHCKYLSTDNRTAAHAGNAFTAFRCQQRQYASDLDSAMTSLVILVVHDIDIWGTSLDNNLLFKGIRTNAFRCVELRCSGTHTQPPLCWSGFRAPELWPYSTTLILVVFRSKLSTRVGIWLFQPPVKFILVLYVLRSG